MHKGCGIIFLSLALTAYAQLMLIPGSTNVSYTTSTTNILGVTRQTVLARPDGTVMDPSGVIVSVANVVAVDMAAREAKQIGEAAHRAMTNALQRLYNATNGAATASHVFRLAVPPEAEREALTGYVVDVETDGTNDTQYIWCNRALSTAPNRSQTYRSWERVSTISGVWRDTAVSNWTANGFSRTVSGKTWTGVHKYVVARPAWARGVRTMYRRNDTFGAAPAGFDFGSVIPTLDGVPAYTGYVTNTVTGAKLYFSNGFLSQDPQGGL